MRIAIYHNLPSGGAKRHTLEQVRELARRGHELVEFAPSIADLTYCSFKPYVREQRVFAFHPHQPLQRRLPLLTPYVHSVQGMATLQRLAQMNRIIAREIDDGGFDLALVKDCHISMNPARSRMNRSSNGSMLLAAMNSFGRRRASIFARAATRNR